MIDAVRVAFTALRTTGAPSPGDLAVVGLEASPEALVAVDHHHRPHLLLRLAGEATDDPSPSDIATLDIGRRRLVFGGVEANMLDVTCLFESVAEVFEHFVVAVLDRLTESQTSPETALGDVLDKWQQFLTPAEGPPGRQKLAAVLGELLVLRDIVHASASRRTSAWVGPFGGRHDFRRADTSLEVKTTRSHTARRVTIHGEDQLEAPEDGQLHLHLVRLEEVPDGGTSVGSLVDELLTLGVTSEGLFEGLAAAGIPLTELASSRDVVFDVRERITFPVDEAMPRIVPSSFSGGARPAGVVDLTYVIDLDHVLARALSDEAYGRLVEALSGEA